MIRHNIKRLPVLRGETLVGVVSRSDLLKGLLAAAPSTNAPRSDAEIKAAIQEELDKLDWAPRASVRVEVADGVVTFGGSIIDERLRSALKVIAENTPGCVAVHDHMAWIEPNSGSLSHRRKTRENPPDAALGAESSDYHSCQHSRQDFDCARCVMGHSSIQAGLAIKASSAGPRRSAQSGAAQREGPTASGDGARETEADPFQPKTGGEAIEWPAPSRGTGSKSAQ